MIRPALPADAAALHDFLTRHEAQAMFPLAALERGDLVTPDAAVTTRDSLMGWVADSGTGITAFLGLGGGGMLLPMGPAANWAAFAPLLAGRQVAGAVGPAAQVRDVLAALGLGALPRRQDSVDPGFSLPLEALVLPDSTGFHSLPLTAAPRDLLIGWRSAYLVTLSGLPPDAAQTRAAEDVGRWIAADSHRVLLRGDAPVAMSGFNARLRDAVQVGGVYTPPALRGRGHARLAVGLHLQAARAGGIARAHLFAASAAAAQAYRALGFAPAGPIGVVELTTPQEVPACP